MKILFKNVTKYTDEEMKKFQKFHKNKNIKKLKLFLNFKATKDSKSIVI